jgi:transposase
MGTPGTRRFHRISVEFKLKAVLMSEQPGVQIKDVAESLCIHPFMLSKWRKQVRDGSLIGEVEQIPNHAIGELQRLRELEVKYKRLEMEHDLLKKAIRFVSERKARSSRSLRQTVGSGQSK